MLQRHCPSGFTPKICGNSLSHLCNSRSRRENRPRHYDRKVTKEFASLGRYFLVNANAMLHLMKLQSHQELLKTLTSRLLQCGIPQRELVHLSSGEQEVWCSVEASKEGKEVQNGGEEHQKKIISTNYYYFMICLWMIKVTSNSWPFHSILGKYPCPVPPTGSRSLLSSHFSILPLWVIFQ